MCFDSPFMAAVGARRGLARSSDLYKTGLAAGDAQCAMIPPFGDKNQVRPLLFAQSMHRAREFLETTRSREICVVPPRRIGGCGAGDTKGLRHEPVREVLAVKSVLPRHLVKTQLIVKGCL
jgi:hypothetical protein